MSADAPYVLELPGDNGTLIFSTRGELQAHFEQMQKVFAPAANESPAFGEFISSVVGIYRPWANDQALVQQGDFEALSKQFRRQFEKWFTPRSAKGSLVLRLHELYGKEASAAAFAVLSDSEPGVTKGFKFLGIVAASNYLLGHPFGEVEARKHWEKLNADVETWFTESKRRLEDLHIKDTHERKLTHSEMTRLRSDCSEAVAACRQKAEQANSEVQIGTAKLIESERTRIDDHVRKTEERLDNLVKTYNQELALQKPMEYWREKETEHRIGLKKWGWIFCVSAVVFAAAFFWFVHDQLPADVSVQHIPLNKIAQVAVLVTIGLWLLRMAARRYVMHLHLANDARERCVMVSTYLSMSSAGGINDEGRNIVMASIFRKASTGIVKEDAAPPTMIPITRGGE